MRGLELLVIVPLAIVLTIVLIRFKAKWSQRVMETYLKENQIDAEVEKSHGIPPLRHWIRNRRGDAWCKVRYADGSDQWARLRSAWGGRRVDFFD